MCKGECDSHFQPRPTPLERLSRDLAAAENTITDLKRRVEWWETYPTAQGALIERLEKMEKNVEECERKHQLKSYFDSNAADSRRALEGRLEKMEKNVKDLEVRHDPLCIGGDKGPCNCQWIRLEKMEKALSEEMAKVREMDDILAGVVKKVGYVSPPATLDQKTLDDIVANPGDYEVKTVTPLDWAARYFQGDMPGEVTSKFASAKFLPDGFQSSDYNFAFDSKASPSGIPFSVAIEYLKAGRKLTHPSFEEGNSIEASAQNSILMHWLDEGKWTNFVMDSVLALSDAWTVLPEKP